MIELRVFNKANTHIFLNEWPLNLMSLLSFIIFRGKESLHFGLRADIFEGGVFHGQNGSQNLCF